MIPRVKAVIVFDGYCHLCSGWVRRMAAADREQYFLFAPLGGAAAGEISRELALDRIADSVILVENQSVYYGSEAVFRIARRLGGWYRLLLIGRLLPLRWFDAVYRFTARNRYRWFGKRASCFMPSPGVRSRFLD